MSMVQEASKNITVEDTFSDPIKTVGDERRLHISLSGTWVAIVTIQVSRDGGTSWLDVDTFTVNGENVGEIPAKAGWRYRFGVETGDFTSGTVVGYITLGKI